MALIYIFWSQDSGKHWGSPLPQTLLTVVSLYPQRIINGLRAIICDSLYTGIVDCNHDGRARMVIGGILHGLPQVPVLITEGADEAGGYYGHNAPIYDPSTATYAQSPDIHRHVQPARYFSTDIVTKDGSTETVYV